MPRAIAPPGAPPPSAAARHAAPRASGAVELIVVGASAGGVDALAAMVRHLPETLQAPLCVVVQLTDTLRGAIPHLLARASGRPASHPADGDPLEPGHIYVAPPDFHLLVEEGRIRVQVGPKENGLRPAIDPLFRSAAQAYGPRVAGVILSGTLDGGASGLYAIARAGGKAIVQDPDDALYPSMPLAALSRVQAHQCTPVVQIGTYLATLAGGDGRAPAARTRAPADRGGRRAAS